MNRRAARRPLPWLGLAGVAAGLLICIIIVYPLGQTVSRLFLVDGKLSFLGVQQTLAEPGLLQTLLNTVVFVGLSGGIALVIGALLAWLFERTDAGLGWASHVVPLVPLLLPALAGTIGWVFLLAPKTGFLNVALRTLTGSEAFEGPLDIFTLAGMVFVASMYLVPYAYLTLSSALRNLDASMEEASRVCGAGLVRTVFRISLPAVTPALISAGVLILMAGIGLFSVPAVLGTTAKFRVLSFLMYVVIEREYPPRLAEAVVLSALALLVIQSVLLVQWLFAGRRYQTIGARGLARAQIPLGAWRWPARILILIYVAAAAVLPLLALVAVSLQSFWSSRIDFARMSLKNYHAILFERPVMLEALQNSLILGGGTALVGMTVASIFSYYIARRSGGIARVLDVTAMLPATVPHIIMGIAFLVAFSQPPLMLYGSGLLLFLAYIALFMPQALQSAKFAFAQVSPELLEASRVFGASEGRTFVRILLPLLLPSTIAGMLILTVLTIAETNASVILSKINNPVVGPTLFNLWYDGLVPPVAAFAVVICAVNTLIALTSFYISRVLFSVRAA